MFLKTKQHRSNILNETNEKTELDKTRNLCSTAQWKLLLTSIVK